MIETIYVEQSCIGSDRVQTIIKRFPRTRILECEFYSQVFNRAGQNFRLQKKLPCLILAQKHKGFVLPAPAGYGIGGKHNFYFSHMLNCLYDCRYCFLQGMYRSANYVLFVNYEDFATDIERKIVEHGQDSVYFFSGYDCDSLALEPVSRFVEFILPVFARNPQAYLELRTKSTQVRQLLDIQAVLPNVIVAFSLSPEKIVQAFEIKTPSLQKRISAMQKLQAKGWPIGLRFDPVLLFENYELTYKEFFHTVFTSLDIEKIHSVSLGGFRMPKHFHEKILKLYPEEPLLSAGMQSDKSLVAYRPDDEKELLAFCQAEILKYI